MESYARGPSFALTTKTAPQVFSDTAEKFADREALVVPHQKIRLTWSQLAAEVEKTARGLIGLGLSPGDRVGVWATNCAEWIYLQLGCARAGLVLVNVNPAYRAHELAYVLDRSGMKALVLRACDARSNYRKILEEAGSRPSHVVYLGEDSWDEMIANGAGIPELNAELPRRPQHAVHLRHHRIAERRAADASQSGQQRTHRRAWAALHASTTASARRCRCITASAASIGTMAVINSGATLILPAPSFDPLATMQAIHDERATAIYGVPTMFIAQLTHPEFSRFDFTSLRTGVMAGAPCPIEVMNRVVNEMHCPQMTIMYGQTECSPVITMAGVDDSVENRVSTVGCACPETEIKIISPDGAIVPVGEQGEICARGYAVMKGYDQDPEATARAVDKDGWLHTGDLATMRPDGYFRITGRLKDMIIRGGENIYPREVEEFLIHPSEGRRRAGGRAAR